MGEDEKERLRHLDERLGQLTHLLINAGERLSEERARNDALRLTLLRLIAVLATTGELDPDDLMSALTLTEIKYRADAKDPYGAAIADEVQQIRLELGRALAPQTAVSQNGPRTILHAARQTLSKALATSVHLIRRMVTKRE